MVERPLDCVEVHTAGLGRDGSHDTAGHDEAEGMDRITRIGHENDIARRSDGLRHVGEPFL